MKAILMSIRPQWVAKILNGEKTVEIRKTHPNMKPPYDVYIYCTKGKTFLSWNCRCGQYLLFEYPPLANRLIYNGKVVAKFTVKKVCADGQGINSTEVLKKACLSLEEAGAYIGFSSSFNHEIYGLNRFYSLYVSDLAIFDKPKELRGFISYNRRHSSFEYTKSDWLDKAPQSWQYIEVEK